MRPNPIVAVWAGRAQTDIVVDEHEIRYYADIGKTMFRQVPSTLGTRLERPFSSGLREPILIMDAADRPDVDRFLIMRFARWWLRDELRVRTPIGRFSDVRAAPLRLNRVEERDIVVWADRSVRAIFPHTRTSCGSASSFVQYADLPIEEMSYRLEAASLDAAARERAGKRSGRLGRAGCRAGIARQIVP